MNWKKTFNTNQFIRRKIWRNMGDINGVKINLEHNKLIFTSGVTVKKMQKSFSSGVTFEQSYVRNWDQCDFFKDKIVSESIDLLKNIPNLESPLRPYYEDHAYALSPNGKWVAFLTRPNTKYQAIKSTVELYLVATDGKSEPILISEKDKGLITSPKFSPNGNYLAWVQMDSDINTADKTKIVYYNLETKKTQIIAKNWDAHFEVITFSNDGDCLYLTIPDNGYDKLFELNIKTEEYKAIVKTGGTSLLKELKDELIVVRHSSKHPQELYSVKKDGNDLKLLSNINIEYLQQFQLNSYEPFYFTGALNQTVQGFIIKPPNFDSTKKYPVIYWSHGGPENPFNDNWSNRWNYQIPVNAGYVLVSINFHGSYGWGHKFINSVISNWGTLPVEDTLKGLDYVLKEHKYLDATKVIAWGGSYGGYMMNMLNGRTNLFKAIVSHAGIFDLTHLYHTIDVQHFMTAELGGDIWDTKVKSIALRDSPSSYIQKWKTPMLVIHGGKDYQVPESEGIATYNALLRRKIPAKFLYFPNESHHVLRNANSLKWMNECLNWSAKWINYTTPYPVPIDN
ncbi:alpha/beta-hydrolase [Neoconidiobolus thromboides FSU 785]|nr:alpha/beta-hydrolase [Neoconidiobolus thromboides FSU 785]